METDFLRDDSWEIACRNGDFVIGESKGQEIDSIMVAAPGHYKENPLIGPAIFRHMRGKADILAIRRQVAISLEMDNKKLQSLTLTPAKHLTVKVQ
jgi:hypothetical protein